MSPIPVQTQAKAFLKHVDSHRGRMLVGTVDHTGCQVARPSTHLLGRLCGIREHPGWPQQARSRYPPADSQFELGPLHRRDGSTFRTALQPGCASGNGLATVLSLARILGSGTIVNLQHGQLARLKSMASPSHSTKESLLWLNPWL